MKLKTASRVYEEYTLGWLYSLEDPRKTAYDHVHDPLTHKHDLGVTSVKTMWGFLNFYKIYKNLEMGTATSIIGLYLLNSISFEKNESINR